MKFLLKNLIIVSIISCLHLHCAQKEDIVAEVGAYTISKSEIVDLLKRKYPKQHSFTDVDISVKKDLLEPLILNKLYLNEGYKKGLNDDPEFINNFENFQMRIIGSKYFERTIVDKLISEQMLEDALAKQGVELKASHIMIAYNKSPRAVKRSLEEARIRANEVLQKLKNGEDFASLVETYSDDPSARSNKGDLGYFMWGKMVPEFFNGAWALEVGQISDPIESPYGFHIIRLEDRRPIKDFEINRNAENLYRTKQALMRTYNDSAAVLWKNHYDRLLEDADYQLYEDKIAEFADTLKVMIKDNPLTAELFQADLRAITLAKWDDDKITVGSLLDKYRTNLARVFSDFREPVKFKAQIERITRDKLVLADAKRLGLDEEEVVARELNGYIEKQMERLIESREIKENVEVSDEEIKAYYDTHRNSFMRPDEIEIWEIDVQDKTLAEQLVARAKKGENFKTLAEKYTEDKFLKKKGGYLGFKNKTGRGSVSKAAHEAGPGGKIGGPVKYGRFWVVFKTGIKHDESVRPLDEVKKRIENLIKNEKIKEEKMDLERKLRETFTVSINEEKLKEI